MYERLPELSPPAVFNGYNEMEGESMVAFTTAGRTSVPEESEVAPYTAFEQLSAGHNPSVSTTPVTTLTCVDLDNGTTTAGATANIDLNPGETVTCPYTNTAACTTDELPTGNIESPGADSYKSGTSIISGSVLVTVDGTAIQTGYGTERTDTASDCGESDNGFGAPWNWNQFGDGLHTAIAYADGMEFLSGVSSSWTILDFPQAGTNTGLA